MTARRFSRYMYSAIIRRNRKLLVCERERVPFRNYRDNRIHVVQEGDDLFHLAQRYFTPLPRAAGLWWVIADFQPQPIHDPTLALEVGSSLVIPSLRTVQEIVFTASRQQEAVP